MIGLGLVDDPSTTSKEFCGLINTSWYFQYRCKAHNLSVWSPNHNSFLVVFKRHYKLTLDGVFRGL